ncbi:MAG TPA: molecular chaperone TorD family protein [Burkholderiales bacterium]|nr:molecular chaperone TorD family protein [Burkholderiales bacterium]
MSSVPDLAEEDLARANLYGLLARLFYAPPDAPLLAALAAADGGAAEGESARGLALAWRELRAAAAAADARAVGEEYESLFAGTGRAPVSLYAGAYLARSAADNPLVEIRGYLAARGLARKSQVNEPEDHIAALCEVMRHIIAQQQTPLSEQSQFFMRFLWPGARPLCDAIEASTYSRLYKQIAMLARNFLEIEHEAFRI